MSEMDLVRRALAGEQDAYTELYVKNFKKVRHLAFRLTHDQDLSEELAHDTLAQAFTKLSGFRGDSQLSSWLGRIVINFVKMGWRQRQRSISRVVSLDDTTEVDWAEILGAVDSNQVGVLDRMALTKAISRLPKVLRQTFLLHRVEGKSCKEIAELLELTVPAMKARAHRANLALKEILLEGKMPDDSQIEYPAPVADEYEQCKAGRVRKGICLDCKGPRHNLDTTGYCRECKPKHGYPVAPTRKSVRTGVDIHQHGAVRHVPVQEQEDLIMDENFINEIWAFIPQEERVTILQMLWPKLPKLTKVAAIRMALERKKTQARTAVAGG